jgi:hypothetical protein
VREANNLRRLCRYERAAFARQNRLLKAFVRNDRIANPTEIKNINLTRKRRSACEGRINATELLREEVSTRRVLKAETFCSSFLSWRTRSRRFYFIARARDKWDVVHEWLIVEGRLRP